MAAAASIPNQQLIVAHPFRFDVSQGGTSFTDPDGDRLTYRVTEAFLDTLTDHEFLADLRFSDPFQ